MFDPIGPVDRTLHHTKFGVVGSKPNILQSTTYLPYLLVLCRKNNYEVRVYCLTCYLFIETISIPAVRLVGSSSSSTVVVVVVVAFVCC